MLDALCSPMNEPALSSQIRSHKMAMFPHHHLQGLQSREKSLSGHIDVYTRSIVLNDLPSYTHRASGIEGLITLEYPEPP